MPEYVLPGTGGADWRDLDAFTQGYIEALFFTENDPSICLDEWTPGHEFVDGSVPCDAGFEELDPDSLAKAKRDCESFQLINRVVLDEAYEMEVNAELYSEEQAGRDFWFTRNGHGVGFWDRELDTVGDLLSAAAINWPGVDTFTIGTTEEPRIALG